MQLRCCTTQGMSVPLLVPLLVAASKVFWLVSHLQVAISYAKSSTPSIVFSMKQGMADRGANLQWISQYPHEAETCFPALTGLDLQSIR